MSGTVPGKVKVEDDASPGSAQEDPDWSMLEGMRSARMASSRETERTVLTMSRTVNVKDIMADVGGEDGIAMVVPFVRWSRGMKKGPLVLSANRWAQCCMGHCSKSVCNYWFLLF